MFLLFYIYRFKSTFQGPKATSWLHPIHHDMDMLNSTLGFERIFVINLPSRLDRRDAMTLAGAVSNLSFTFLEGLKGDQLPPSSFAASSADRKQDRSRSSNSASAGAWGSWRAHMNALQTIINHDMGSALVLEDDVDWDVRLKLQMRTFAIASRKWLDIEGLEREAGKKTNSRSYPVPAAGLMGMLPPMSFGKREQRTYSGSTPPPVSSSDFDTEHHAYGEAMKEEFERDTIPLSSSSIFRPDTSHGQQHSSSNIERSPYGDNWDVLWLGHCGVDLPAALLRGRSSSPLSTVSSTTTTTSSSSPLSLGIISPLKISIPDDDTVPAPKHLRPHPFALPDQLASVYPAHTRVVHAANGNICSLAYAVSQRGARKLLWQFAQTGFASQWDLMLRDFCMGKYEHGDGERGAYGSREREDGKGGQEVTNPVCLTVQPPLISHHYAGERGTNGAGGAASVSDIRGQGGGFAGGKKGTPYVRLSVHANLRHLVSGVPASQLVDQLPDDGDTLW
ncbi:hypothetical protein F5Y19DRAFT_480155 [Xylariaceae sp. FL1651]|nr:hypothetical protein F5Y19DRAFT_480155 [Xylariaceae sp. FL1651]